MAISFWIVREHEHVLHAKDKKNGLRLWPALHAAGSYNVFGSKPATILAYYSYAGIFGRLTSEIARNFFCSSMALNGGVEKEICLHF